MITLRLLPILTLIGFSLLGCGPPEHSEVLVLANSASPVSVAIGQHYLKSRNIPAENLFMLEIPLDDPSLGDNRHETIQRKDFKRLIEEPLRKYLLDNGQVENIRIIVTTKGVPLRIEGPSSELARLLSDATTASVDAELSLLFSPWLGRPGVSETPNPYFGDPRTFEAFREDEPHSPLRYLVARLTGYLEPGEEPDQVPRQIVQLIEAAQKSSSPETLWLLDQDPELPPALDVANQILLDSTEGVLTSMGLEVLADQGPEFIGNQGLIQAYSSWGSNATSEVAPKTYGLIEGGKYPGEFAARALVADLVSTNGRTFTHPPQYGQSLMADLLALGAAGAAGQVAEPSLAAIARPQLLFSFYAKGDMAIEAYYKSIPYLGWVNVYVGDPLMRLEHPPPTPTPLDLDGDGYFDARDNCLLIPNPEQRDTDGDGFGNLCDADINGDGRVTTSWGETFPRSQRGDLESIALTARDGQYDANHDLDGDGRVDQRDVSISQLQLFHAPGPSGMQTTD